MDEGSDSDTSDLDNLISVACNKLKFMNQNTVSDGRIYKNKILSPTLLHQHSRSCTSKEDMDISKRPETSIKLECCLPKCDLTAICNESLENEVSSSVLLKPGLGKVRSLSHEQSMRQVKRDRRKEREMTKGDGWFNLPAPEMTDSKKNDLMVLQMRKVLDPKRFYKGSDLRGSLPKYFQVGSVVESAADFYGSRIPKSKRKSTLVDELLNDAEFRRYNKKKYEEIEATHQTSRRSGAHRHMKRQKKHKK